MCLVCSEIGNSALKNIYVYNFDNFIRIIYIYIENHKLGANKK